MTAPAPVVPVAAFTATPTTGVNPLTVTVVDNSGGQPTSWSWNFGDGSPTSNLPDPPPHVYTNPGSYTITLNVANAVGPSVLPATQQIVVGNACQSAAANFTYSQQNKNRPVDFVGSPTPGTCPVTQWTWAFGDGATATGQVLSHAYAYRDTYTVTLTVTTASGDSQDRTGDDEMTTVVRQRRTGTGAR